MDRESSPKRFVARYGSMKVKHPTIVLALLIATTTACDSEGDAAATVGTGAASPIDGGNPAANAGGSSAGGNGVTGASGTSGGPTLGGGGANGGGATSSGAGATAAGGRTSTGGTGPAAGGTSAGGMPSGTGNTSGNPSDAGCPGVGTACDPDRTICCSGLVCVTSTSPDYAGCRQSCATASDCSTGCCIPFANIPNKGFCGAALLCQCAGQDETCGGARQCCSGFSCSTFDQTGALACHKLCTQNSDCSTNCCVKVNGTADSVCLPAKPWCGQ